MRAEKRFFNFTSKTESQKLENMDIETLQRTVKIYRCRIRKCGKGRCFLCFNEGNRELTQDDILEEIRRLNPRLNYER